MPLYDKDWVKEIYDLAKANDVEGLKKIVNAGLSLEVFQNQYNAPFLLARNGLHQPVALLMDVFKIKEEAVIQGYAAGGYMNKVEDILKKHSKRIFTPLEPSPAEAALIGYTQGGYEAYGKELMEKWLCCGPHNITVGHALNGDVSRVNNLLATGINECWAQMGYALANHNVDMEDIYIRNGILRAYAKAGNYEKVNQMLLRGADYMSAYLGYKDGNHYTKGNIIRLIASHTDTSLIRSWMDNIPASWDLDKEKTLEYAIKIREVMYRKKLNFTQAQVYLATPSVWMLQGQQLVTHKDLDGNSINNDLPSLPVELYKHIASYVTGHAFDDKIHSAANKIREVLPTHSQHGMTFFRREIPGERSLGVKSQCTIV